MPIALAPLNQLLTIKKILVNDKIKKHLESLGITINAQVTILSSTGGNIILLIKSGRLALDADIARRIFVA